MEDRDDYLKTKRRKLWQQFNANNEEESGLFAGLCFYVDGVIDPPQIKLKQMIASNGGSLLNHFDARVVTHTLADNLATAKANKMKGARVVRPQWLMDCLEQKRLLPDNEYRVLDREDSVARFLQDSRSRADTSSSVTANTSVAGMASVGSSATATMASLGMARTGSSGMARTGSSGMAKTGSSGMAKTTSSEMTRTASSVTFITGSNFDFLNECSEDLKKSLLEDIGSKAIVKGPESHVRNNNKKNNTKTNIKTKTKGKMAKKPFKCQNTIMNAFSKSDGGVLSSDCLSANICGKKETEDVIALIEEWVDTEQDLFDEDVAYVTKYFFDLIEERKRDRVIQVFLALFARVQQRNQSVWKQVVDDLRDMLKGEDFEELPEFNESA